MKIIALCALSLFCALPMGWATVAPTTVVSAKNIYTCNANYTAFSRAPEVSKYVSTRWIDLGSSSSVVADGSRMHFLHKQIEENQFQVGIQISSGSSEFYQAEIRNVEVQGLQIKASNKITKALMDSDKAEMFGIPSELLTQKIDTKSQAFSALNEDLPNHFALNMQFAVPASTLYSSVFINVICGKTGEEVENKFATKADYVSHINAVAQSGEGTDLELNQAVIWVLMKRSESQLTPQLMKAMGLVPTAIKIARANAGSKKITTTDVMTELDKLLQTSKNS